MNLEMSEHATASVVGSSVPSSEMSCLMTAQWPSSKALWLCFQKFSDLWLGDHSSLPEKTCEAGRAQLRRGYGRGGGTPRACGWGRGRSIGDR